ncbi:MAG: hypothetical protein Q9184_004489 [Pyrenodesmia sp. 2 TL-2023]
MPKDEVGDKWAWLPQSTRRRTRFTEIANEEMSLAYQIPLPYFDRNALHHPNPNPEAAYPQNAYAGPSYWNDQNQPMASMSQYPFPQAPPNFDPYAAYYGNPPSQLPEQGQMASYPNDGVPEQSQESSFGSTIPPWRLPPQAQMGYSMGLPSRAFHPNIDLPERAQENSFGSTIPPWQLPEQPQIAFHPDSGLPEPAFYPDHDLPHPAQENSIGSTISSDPNSGEPNPGFHPDNGLPKPVQENSLDSTSSSDSNYGEPNPLAGLGNVTYTTPSSMSPNPSPEQQFEPAANEGSLKGKEREVDTVGNGHWPYDMPQTTVHSMPSSYATAENPMTQDRLTQLQQSSQLYSHQVPQCAPYGIAGSVAPSAEGFIPHESMYVCGCGPGCQCVACVVHPFNDCTMGRMGELSDIMAAENAALGAENWRQSGYEVPSPNTVTGPEVDSGNWESMAGLADGVDPSQLTNEHPPTTSSAYGNYGMPTAGGPALDVAHSSKFFTMQYHLPGPVPILCSVGNITCRCGEDCPCMGCRTHSGHKL